MRSSEKTNKKRGAPRLYKKEYTEQARKLCLLGYTNEELADFFNVSLATIKNWMRNIPEFLAAIKNGKDLADAKTTDSLFTRANGIKYKEIKTKIDGDKQITEITEKYIPPDPVSMIFWLKNRQRKRWRDKPEDIDENSIEDKKIYIHNSLYIPNSFDNKNDT